MRAYYFTYDKYECKLLPRIYSLLISLVRNLDIGSPMKIGLFGSVSINSVKNSRMGPPMSTDPSRVPSSSVNTTSILFAGVKDFLEKPLTAPSQTSPRQTLNFDVTSSLIGTANSAKTSCRSMLSSLKEKGLSGESIWSSWSLTIPQVLHWHR